MRLETPAGWDEVVQLFGDPTKYRREDGTLSPAWEADHIVRINLPQPLRYVDGGTVTRIAVHKLIADVTLETLRRVAETSAFWAEIQPYGGSFEPRLKRGTNKPSLHTFGIALDFNPTKYPLGSDKRMPDELVRIFIEHGFYYGGDFRGRLDPMHFQFARRI